VTRGKGESSIYKDDRGYWVTAITLPSRDGKRRRKVIRRTTKAEVLAEMDRWRAELREYGDLNTNDMTVKQWFTYWLRNIAAKDVRPKTFERYEQISRLWVIPTIGTVRMSQLKASHVRSVTDAMVDAGGSPDTAVTAHRIMSVAFEWAVREQKIGRNPAKLMAAPRKGVPTLEVLDLQETLDLYAHVKQQGGPQFALWATTLLYGLRRGEVLGLQEDRVTDVLDVSWQLQRLKWQHGCDDTCGLTASNCPERHLDVPNDYEYQPVGGGLFLTRPKSKNGWRIIPLVEPLRSVLREHMEQYPAGSNGFLFTTRGKPLDPNNHSRQWRELLKQTGIEKNVRLHDLRHGAIDLLTLAGLPDDLIVQIAGHASRLQTNAYRRRHDVERMRLGLSAMTDLLAGHKSARPSGDVLAELEDVAEAHELEIEQSA
jgi:integrase